MIQRLVVRRAEGLVEIGRPILAKLQADARLSDSASSMKTTQSALESIVDVLVAARTSERLARVQRDENHRVLAAQVREFGFMVLSINGNHHNSDPYLLYFPQGYGDAMQLLPAELEAFARGIVAKLEQETDAKILAHRAPLEEALTRFQASEAAYQAALSARREAFSLAQAEKRSWTRGVVKARALAEAECHFERAYVRAIFAAIRSPRRDVEEGSETEEAAGAILPVPQVVPVMPVTPSVEPEMGSDEPEDAAA